VGQPQGGSRLRSSR